MSKGQSSPSGGIFVTVIITALVIGVMAYAFSSLMSEGSANYNSTYEASVYNNLNRVNEIQNLTSDMNEAFIGTNRTAATGGLSEAFNDAFLTGITVTRLATSIPGTYRAIIQAGADTVGIDAFYVNVAFIILVVIIIGVGLALLLGRYI